MSLAVAQPARSVLFASVMVGLSAIGFGMVPLFARTLTEAGIAAPAISLFRYILPAVVFLPFLRVRGSDGRATLWGFVAGILTGLGWIGYVKGLELMPVSTAGLLYMTYPMFTLAIGWVVFGSRPHRLAVVASALILVAAAIASRPSDTGLPVSLAAIGLGLAAPLSFGLAINVLAQKLIVLPTTARLASFSAGSAVALLPLVTAIPLAEVIPSTPILWAWVVALGLVSALIPQLLYSGFVPMIGAARSAALGSIELPTMFAVGWFAFSEALGWREALAGVLVMTAIVMTPAARPGKAPE